MESQSHAYAPCGNPVQGGKCGGNKRRKSDFVKDVKEYCTAHDHLPKIKDLPSVPSVAGFCREMHNYFAEDSSHTHFTGCSAQMGIYFLYTAVCAPNCSDFNP